MTHSVFQPKRRGLVMGAAWLGLGLAHSAAWAQTMALSGPITRTPRLSPRVELFAHRGCSAQRPEHTLAAYVLAMHQGADYIEPDLVCTKDGVLVARHENNLTETTDVSTRSEFAAKRVTKTIDGVKQEGWFVEDFTLDELKRLRAIERLPQVRVANTAFDGQYQIPTLEEVIEVVAAHAQATGRVIGLVPELKHSTHHHSVGLNVEEILVRTLSAHTYTQFAPLEIQSFEVSNLKVLRDMLGRRRNLRIMQLVDAANMRPGDAMASGSSLTYADIITAKGLKAVAQYADVVAPSHRMVIPLNADQSLGQPTRLVADAHDAGLLVHTWTFRPENRFMATNFRSNRGENARHDEGSIAEMHAYIAAGVDGFFTDDSALGLAAIKSYA
jgi:glycerophosphoryl diester phosphodiesterase